MAYRVEKNASYYRRGCLAHRSLAPCVLNSEVLSVANDTGPKDALRLGVGSEVKLKKFILGSFLSQFDLKTIPFNL